MTVHDAAERAHEQEILARAHLRGKYHELLAFLKEMEFVVCKHSNTASCPECYGEGVHGKRCRLELLLNE